MTDSAASRRLEDLEEPPELPMVWDQPWPYRCSDRKPPRQPPTASSENVHIDKPLALSRIKSQPSHRYVPSVDLMQRFRNVVELAFPTPFYYPDDLESHDDAVASGALLDITSTIDFKGVMDAICLDNLQSLTLNAEHIGALPLKVLETLKELDICVTTTAQAVGLDLILRHALVLESLTIFGYLDQDVFLWLGCDASALPALTSFRLSIDRFTMPHPPSDHHLDMLIHFLGDRNKLRRLYLRIPTIGLFGLDALAPVIRKMEGLEVLGLHTGLTGIDDQFIPFLESIIPVGIRALYFAMDWTGSNLLPLVSS